MAETTNRFFAILLLTLLVTIGALFYQLWIAGEDAEELSAEMTQIAADISEQAATLTVVAQTTPEPTLPPESTITPTPDRVATAQADATIIANIGQAWLDEALAWPVALSDTFDDNALEWGTDSGSDEYSTGERAVRDGHYLWDITAVRDFSWVSTPDFERQLADFMVSADFNMTTSLVGEMHVVFRFVDFSNYYTFGLCNGDAGYEVWVRHENSWDGIRACQRTGAIVPDGTNRFTVVGKGSAFAFYINDTYLETIRDPRLPTGIGGVFIEMDEAQQNTFFFDNFELRSP